MKTVSALALVALGSAVVPAQQPAPQRGTQSPAITYDQAVVAWQRGDYPAALDGLIRVASGAGSESYLSQIALLTGELYRTTEIASDGRAVRWSPDGRFAAFEVGTGRSVRTKVLDMTSEPKVVAELRGVGLVFSRDGQRAAYIALGDSGGSPANALIIRSLSDGSERPVADGGLLKASLAFSADGGTLYLVGTRPSEERRTTIYAVSDAGAVSPITVDDSVKTNPIVVPGGRFLIYTVGGASPLRLAGGSTPSFQLARPSSFAVFDLTTKTAQTYAGLAPTVSADGSTIAYLGRDGTTNVLSVVSLPALGAPAVVKRTTAPLAAPALSPNGRRVAYQMQQEHDWEIWAADRDGASETRVTREIQHDLQPRFLDDTRLLAVMGEARHRRSYLYDLTAGTRTRLFHNNTVRTIAPEYEWAPSPDGRKLLIVSERDGDTVSPERGVYLMDLGQTVVAADVLARLRASLTAEKALRAAGERSFKPIATAVSERVADVSKDRIFSYEKALFDFDSKFFSRPGNAKARQYLFERYASFGYEPRFQEFETRPTAQRPALKSANVIATLKGTVNPDLVYVVGSHFDSVEGGAGADDNTSGTAALLEAARVLARNPMPATIVFVSFTGEEGGLLGSREFVRQAIAEKWKVVGALNNDMLGWTNDQRLDNTIRYSNPGIRDIQHAAAFLFTDMITYDALYYKGTNAAAFYEGWGDIVGGIGSYPVLGNPHYHQPHDNLEYENHQLIAEASKTTVATIMLLASSPSRLSGLTARLEGSAAELTWTPSPEKGVRRYLVRYTPASGAERTVTVTEPRVRLTDVAAGTTVAVKAVNERGLEGWDWARVTVGAPAR